MCHATSRCTTIPICNNHPPPNSRQAPCNTHGPYNTHVQHPCPCLSQTHTVRHATFMCSTPIASFLLHMYWWRFCSALCEPFCTIPIRYNPPGNSHEPPAAPAAPASPQQRPRHPKHLQAMPLINQCNWMRPRAAPMTCVHAVLVFSHSSVIPTLSDL